MTIPVNRHSIEIILNIIIFLSCQSGIGLILETLFVDVNYLSVHVILFKIFIFLFTALYVATRD